MPIDKNDIRTWVKFKESLCYQCIGTCCGMPVEVQFDDLIRMGVATEDDRQDTRRKLVNRLKKQGVIQSYRDNTGLFTLSSRPNGDCMFLHPQTRLCTIYNDRPNVCRRFPVSMGNRIGYCPAISKALNSCNVYAAT